MDLTYYLNDFFKEYFCRVNEHIYYLLEYFVVEETDET